MSPEWSWAWLLALILLPALGHLYHFILAVNLSSALGYRESVMDRVRAAIFMVLVVSSAVLFWKHMGTPWWTWGWPVRSYALLCIITGGVCWPLNSIHLALRKRTQGVLGRTRLHDLAGDHGTEALIGEGKHAWLLKLPGNQAFQLRTRQWELEFPDLPAPLDGLSILQLTDLHFAPCFRREFFERVVQACSGWTADLVVVTGDVVDDAETIGWIEPVLGPLQARLGKYAILGNHDFEHQPKRILESLAAAGFESLEGRWITHNLDGARLSLGGTSAPWGPALDSGEIPDADFRTLLSHSPDLFRQARRWGIDLMLSGHNHGGQIRLPGVGPVFMPSRYSRRFDRGFFRRGSMLMYVSEGIAGKHPYRFGCPPEVCRFVLCSAKPLDTRETTSSRSLVSSNSV